MVAGASACDEHPLLPRPLKLLLKLRQLCPAALQLHNVRLQNKVIPCSKECEILIVHSICKWQQIEHDTNALNKTPPLISNLQ